MAEEENKIRYWVHPESSCVWYSNDGINQAGELVEELTKEEYEKICLNWGVTGELNNNV